MPISLGNLEAYPTAFMGPNITGLFIQAIEMGILINQGLTFLEHVAERERLVVRLLAAFVMVIATLQTGLGFFSAWRIFVLNFGNWPIAENFSWADRIQSTTTVCMAAPVQSFLIWRCWTLMNRSWLVLTPLSLILLASVISSTIVTSEALQIQFSVITDPTAVLPDLPPNITFILALTCSAVLDVAVTGILLFFLWRSKQNVVSSRFRRILKRLTMLVWEAALPPCICAICTVVTYLLLVNDDYWDLMFQAILGKLYVISLFVTINGRAELQNAPVMTTGQLSDVVWPASNPIHVSISAHPDGPVSHNSTQSEIVTPGTLHPSPMGLSLDLDKHG
ncbi:hypothetical protein CERSUDRAFT_86396 [Gelatoporia subvermispora B]|uniref:DUF6534 domain-containing protein n=1 Tax=Ceriporiopsis subvermispora (strain B) TaxID=914234 RepID=M2PEH1_CERS8|nr:hypothetical protein CERSUDRAFT_86396 [Gelatoporia subvermispora B]